MHLEEGTIIAEHYRLVKHLGEGSFGNVWLAHNLLADIDVAIKFYGTLDKNGLEEFRNEFKIAYRLNHPNLLNISHFDVADNCPYLVMPYCENGSLSNRIGQMPESDIWKFLLDVSCGLAFLHSQQPPIVHQDIKPANILVTSDGRYVISDFGISRSLRTQLTRTANNASMSGTIAYMGPERFSDKPMIVLTSDVWALGMTAYELMTGNVLWEGMGGCVQLNGARIPDIEGNFSPELVRLVKSCLARETWNRPTAMQIHEHAAARLRSSYSPPQLTPLTTYPSTHPSTPSHHTSAPSHHTSAPSPHVSTPSFLASLLNNIWVPQSKKILLIAAAVIIIAILLVVGGKVISALNEEHQFVSCKTVEDYQQFINDYPSSPYAESARRSIYVLSPKADPARQAALTASPITEESGSAANNESSTTISAPNKESGSSNPAPIKESSLFNSDTEKPVEIVPVAPAKPKPSRSHRNKPKRTADDDAFYRCHTATDYHNYLLSYPNGKHRRDAERALTRLVNH